jgi:hypothetical protein
METGSGFEVERARWGEVVLVDVGFELAASRLVPRN